MDAKKRITASIHGLDSSILPAKTLISSRWLATKVVPSHATPRTQIQALMPDLKVDAFRIFFVSILQKRVIRVAAASMNEIMA